MIDHDEVTDLRKLRAEAVRPMQLAYALGSRIQCLRSACLMNSRQAMKELENIEAIQAKLMASLEGFEGMAEGTLNNYLGERPSDDR